jgi:bacterioferritin-associated ferredoxin
VTIVYRGAYPDSLTPQRCRRDSEKIECRQDVRDRTVRRAVGKVESVRQGLQTVAAHTGAGDEATCGLCGTQG